MNQKIKVGELDVTYRFDGPADRPVLLMSNSLMSNLTMWDPTVPALADRFRILRYDTRGHGQTTVTPGPYSIGMLADDAVGLLDALGIRQAHIMGLSMGGMIAQQIGARYPDRALSLLLCDTASEMPPRTMWEERLAIARSQGISGLVDGTIKRWFTAPFIERAPQEIAKVREMILGTPVEGYMNCAGAVRDMAQTTMLLKIKAPTLVITGRQDPACTVEQSTVLHRMIDTSRMIVIEDAAHLSNIEQPSVFNREIRNFLDTISD
ncbi:MAG: 3-oxoadipate enol-lactonase [Burkholderiaceae bacterium]|jgi:3-oxoadipate enol-lactonase|nr:3-oxoadipate enol-lactonase [Burkholderiaceae bacterium]